MVFTLMVDIVGKFPFKRDDTADGSGKTFVDGAEQSITVR